MHHESNDITLLPAGRVRGRMINGITCYLGIPYAKPPVGSRRFKAPEPLSGWSGVLDATQEPKIAPQASSRIAAVLGDFDGLQSEDCLTLCVYTPGPDHKKRPVIVWIHGGAYSTGAGSLRCHSGETWAREHNVVVVCLNFRLGALGFLYIPEFSEGNMGMLDQIEALQWLRRNVMALGGDPENMTIAGQSSGAGSVVCLTAMPQALGLFKRAIVQSAPLGRVERTPERAAELGSVFLHHAGVANPTELQSLSVEKILQAQATYSRTFSAPLGATSLPFMPVTDGKSLLSMSQVVDKTSAMGCDLIIGTVREEMAAFYAVDNKIRTISRHEAVGSLCSFMSPAEAAKLYDNYAKRRASDLPVAILGDAFTDGIFRSRSIELALRFSANGHAVYAYRFDVQSPAGFGACHCFDVPFVFNNLSDWSASPMLQGMNEGRFKSISRKIQGAWACFAHAGNPNHDAIPHWEQVNPQTMQMMKIDDVFETGPIERDMTMRCLY